MSSNRLLYDKCAYDIEIKESISPLDYYLFKGKYETVKCEKNEYENNIKFEDRAITENELYGLTKTSTKCPEKKYSKEKGNEFTPIKLSPQIICQGIHHITPSNIDKPKSSMLKKLNTSII